MIDISCTPGWIKTICHQVFCGSTLYICFQKIYCHTAWVSPTPCCHSLPLGDGISSSETTYGWLQDALFIHVQGLELYTISSANIIWPKSQRWSGWHQSCLAVCSENGCIVYKVYYTLLSFAELVMSVSILWYYRIVNKYIWIYTVSSPIIVSVERFVYDNKPMYCICQVNELLKQNTFLQVFCVNVTFFMQLL